MAINYAMGYLPVSRVSVTLIAQPVITAVLGIIFLNEILSGTDILGGILVLTGIYLVNQHPQPSVESDAYTQSA